MCERRADSLLDALVAIPPSFDAVNPKREAAFLAFARFLEEHVREGQSLDLARSPNPLWTLIEQRLTACRKAAADPAPCRRLYQLYNSGMLFRDGMQTIGVDVTRMPRVYGWPEPPGLADEYADLLDVLLVTHHHADHFDPAVVEAVLAQRKPVCMPRSERTVPYEHEALFYTLDDWEGRQAGFDIRARRSVHVWRDTPDEVPTCYYEVTAPSGFTVLFTGDTDYTRPFDLRDDQPIDLLCLTWRNPNARYEEGHADQIGTTEEAVEIALKAVRPACVLLEHYAELEHIYKGFTASYDLARRLKRSLPVPAEWLAWGESISL